MLSTITNCSKNMAGFFKDWFGGGEEEPEKTQEEIAKELECANRVREQDWSKLTDIAELYAQLRTPSLIFADSVPTDADGGHRLTKMLTGEEIIAIIRDMVQRKEQDRLKELPERIRNTAGRLIGEIIWRK